MGDVATRIVGRAGRITLTRPKALNALSYDMCLEIDKALIAWADDPQVDLVIMDAEGEKAFCAGGDIAQLYQTGKAGDHGYARDFWRDEYRMNARIAAYPKPIVSFMQGFVMGGGVGLGCHGSHRIVGESSKMAMPECGIGLVPDVGGTCLLARAPGRMGAYLGLTGARMGPGDAIRAGFADAFVPEDDWPAVIAALQESGTTDVIPQASDPAAPLVTAFPAIDAAFTADTPRAMLAALDGREDDLAVSAAKALRRGSPIAMGVTLAIINRLKALDTFTIRDALRLEYRFTWRAMEHADFLEGVRAQIIDKDRTPTWRDTLESLDAADVTALLDPLGADELTFDEEERP